MENTPCLGFNWIWHKDRRLKNHHGRKAVESKSAAALFVCDISRSGRVCVCVPYLSTTCWPPWSPYTAVCGVDGPFGCPTCCEMTLQLLHENEWNYRLTRKFSVKERAVLNQSSAGWVGGRERGRKGEGGTCKTALSLWQHNGLLFFFFSRKGRLILPVRSHLNLWQPPQWRQMKLE